MSKKRLIIPLLFHRYITIITSYTPTCAWIQWMIQQTNIGQTDIKKKLVGCFGFLWQASPCYRCFVCDVYDVFDVSFSYSQYRNKAKKKVHFVWLLVGWIRMWLMIIIFILPFCSVGYFYFLLSSFISALSSFELYTVCVWVKESNKLAIITNTATIIIIIIKVDYIWTYKKKSRSI